MKYILISLMFLVSSVAFGSTDDDHNTRFGNVLSMAENSLANSDIDMFNTIIKTAIKNLSNVADSADKEDKIAAVMNLVDSAEASIDTDSYNRLIQQVQSL